MGKPPKIKIVQRPRRNRRTPAVRALVRETYLSPGNLVMPYFILDGKKKAQPVVSMPGIDKLSIDLLIEDIARGHDDGIMAVALFPVIDDKLKDRQASESRNPDGLLQRAVRAVKKKLPGVAVITDVAMDPYSSDGHDGVVKDGEIINDATLPVLVEMAVAQARAGADFVAPSDMMDGRVAFIRDALDRSGFENTGILSYAAKYASSFYGPFRDALSSAPKAGDKKSYQMDPSNSREALREVFLDIEEGADIVMVKPALSYLDVIRTVKDNVEVPVAAYNVSGEYAMIKAAAQKGWLDEKAAALESLLSIRRAGADIIFTYFARQIAKDLS